MLERTSTVRSFDLSYHNGINYSGGKNFEICPN